MSVGANDKLVDQRYGDGRVGNPYERYPERSSWVEFETWERPDGTRYTLTRHASRWGGVFSYEPWQKEQS